LGLGDGLTLGVGDGVTFGRGFKSLGPTWPITGMWDPIESTTGTAFELWSCGCRKSTKICCSW
jgi:hypothetical protein